MADTLPQEDIDSDPYRALKDVFCGTAGGIAQVLVGQPFDTTKVRIQSAPPGTYSSSWDVVKKLLAKEGPLAFYKIRLLRSTYLGSFAFLVFFLSFSDNFCFFEE